MKITLLTLCDYAEISKTGKLSLMGIKDKQLVKKIPGVHPGVYFGAVVRGKAESEAELKMIINDPMGKKMLDKDISFKIGESGKSNLVMHINNLKVTQAGKYTLMFKKKGKLIGGLDFFVVAPAKSTKKKDYLPN